MANVKRLNHTPAFKELEKITSNIALDIKNRICSWREGPSSPAKTHLQVSQDLRIQSLKQMRIITERYLSTILTDNQSTGQS